MSVPIDHPRRCRARSSRTGAPCRKWACRGMRVCRTHGGGAPQVRARASERMTALVDPAAAKIARTIRLGDPHLSWRAAQHAINAALRTEDHVPPDRVVELMQDLAAAVLRWAGAECDDVQKQSLSAMLRAYRPLGDATPALPQPPADTAEELVL